MSDYDKGIGSLSSDITEDERSPFYRRESMLNQDPMEQIQNDLGIAGLNPNATPVGGPRPSVSGGTSIYSSVVKSSPEIPTALFRTSSGSTYAQYKNHTSTRDKKERKEHPGEFGIQPRSGRTIFMKTDEMNQISGVHQNPEIPTRFTPVRDGKVALVYTGAPGAFGSYKPGDVLRGSEVNFSKKPEKGLHPVEIWAPDSHTGVHFGNEITHVALPE